MSNRPIIDWEEWLASPPGQYMLQWEASSTTGRWRTSSAITRCSWACPPSTRCARTACRSRRWRSTAAPARTGRETHPDARQLLCRFDELPFDTQSIDLLTLPHVLEFSEDPHEVLREVSRVLMPEGRVVVTCFNPMSLWGARQGLNRLGATPFLQRRPDHRLRADQGLAQAAGIRDHPRPLRLLLPALPHRALAAARRFMEKAGDRWWPIFGSVYMISAVKRVKNIRLVGPRGRPPSPR
jgi:SAM-dependent methyltransferase